MSEAQQWFDREGSRPALITEASGKHSVVVERLAAAYEDPALEAMVDGLTAEYDHATRLAYAIYVTMTYRQHAGDPGGWNERAASNFLQAAAVLVPSPSLPELGTLPANPAGFWNALIGLGRADIAYLDAQFQGHFAKQA